MGDDVDEYLNLESLKLLKKTFDEADEDGSGELDMDEFCTKLGPHLGTNLTRQQVSQLFMKIDADAGGTVDWDEFTNYMFLERAQTTGDGATENWRLFPQDFKIKSEASCAHHDQVDSIAFCAPLDKYITCGRDGSLRMWSAGDVKHFKTVNNGASWITDSTYMPLSRKLVVTTVDRSISYYDVNRASYDLVGRVYASGTMGVPMTLNVLSNDSGERVIYGDSQGNVAMLLCSTREWPSRDLISTEHHRDYLYLHEEHTDWVTKLLWVPEMGLLSTSLDCTIKTYDITREKVVHTCDHHTKGVHSLVYCSAYSVIASCGLERDVIVWHSSTGRRVGELVGHTASVAQIALDERLNHVFTLGVDSVIKVWDLRTHRCLQTIGTDDWVKPGENRPTALVYDGVQRRLVTALTRPYVWPHKIVSQDRTGHQDPIRGALYNPTFHVVVSADEGGTVCVWNMSDGSREGRFSNAHGTSRLTAMAFDQNARRLMTAANDGVVKMWNFNNGSLLREYVHDDEQLEITTVLFAADEKRFTDTVYAGGWNCKVYLWQDEDEERVTEYRTYDGHREDITHMAACKEKNLLATGDYEGRINIWDLHTGEKRMWMCHRAERYETSVERLAWLPCTLFSEPSGQPSTSGNGNRSHHGGRAFRPRDTTGRGAAAAAASMDGAGAIKGRSEDSPSPSLSLNGGGSNGRLMADESSPSTSFRQSADDELHPNSGANGSANCSANGHAGASRRSSCDHATSPLSTSTSQVQQLSAIERQQSRLLAPAATRHYSHLILLSCGGDGMMRVWLITTTARILCTLPAAQGLLEQSSSICTDEQYNFIIIGDTAGHVRIYDVSAGVDIAGPPEACAASFKPRAHWRAREGAISSVDVLRGRQMVIVGSRDCSVTVWTFDGELVSTLGEGPCDLDDRRKWVDNEGPRRRPVMDQNEGLYLQVPEEERGSPSAAFTVDGVSCSADDEDGESFAGLSRATVVLQERKQRIRRDMVAKPRQPHSMLDVRDITDVPQSAAAILHGEPDAATKADKARRPGPVQRGRPPLGRTTSNASSKMSLSALSALSRSRRTTGATDRDG